MIDGMPCHSIIVASHNQAQFLPHAIESALAQTDGDLEVVVVDDGSTDDSAEVAGRYVDPRVTLIRQENRGLSAARNAGLLRSTGETVAFLDADDLLLPDHLETLGAFLRESPDYDAVAGNCRWIDGTGGELPGGSRRPAADGPELLLGNPFHVAALLVRRAALDEVGLFDEALVAGEDWDLWMRLALAGRRIGVSDRVVSLYRQHDSQMTQDAGRMRSGLLDVLRNVFERDDLPPEWACQSGRAYGLVHARSAARWFLVGDVQHAIADLQAAVHADPGWAADGGSALARLLSGWAFSPQCPDPLSFLSLAYSHLPDSLSALRRQRRRRLAAAARHASANAFSRGDAREGRSLLWRALYYSPALALDRGIASTLARAYFGRVDGRRSAP